MAPKAEGLKRELRRFRFQARFIFYRGKKGFIAIPAILHHAQDWRRKLRV